MDKLPAGNNHPKSDTGGALYHVKAGDAADMYTHIPNGADGKKHHAKKETKVEENEELTETIDSH